MEGTKIILEIFVDAIQSVRHKSDKKRSLTEIKPPEDIESGTMKYKIRMTKNEKRKTVPIGNLRFQKTINAVTDRINHKIAMPVDRTCKGEYCNVIRGLKTKRSTNNDARSMASNAPPLLKRKAIVNTREGRTEINIKTRDRR